MLTTDGTGLASWVAAPAGPPNGAAGGDLGGTYPNPTVGKLHDNVRNLVFGNCPVTVGATDSYISIDATGGACTVNLPASVGGGSRVSIEKTDASVNTVTVSRNAVPGTDTIDGATTVVLGAQYEVAEILDAVTGTFHRATLPFVSGDVTGPLTATTVAKVTGVVPASCTNQFLTSIGVCATDTLASAQHANQGTTTTILHGNAAGNPSFTGVSLANDTAANQGSTTTVLHGNAAGQPSFAGVSLANDTAANQGTTTTVLHGNGAGQPAFAAVTAADVNANASSIGLNLNTSVGNPAVDANTCTGACPALYSFSVPAMTATNTLRFTAVLLGVNTTTATSMELTIAFGGSTVCDTGSNLGNLANNATPTPFKIVIEIANLNATNAQMTHCWLMNHNQVTATQWNNMIPGTSGAMSDSWQTTAIDTTSAKTFALNVIFGASSASTHMKLYMGRLEEF